MSKKRHKKGGGSPNNISSNIKDNKKSAYDSFQNPLARLGYAADNLMEQTQYPITRITRDYNLLNSLYRNSWIIKKIINTVPEDMCKNWFNITAEVTPEVQDRYNKLEKKTKVREKILECLFWGRLYGGAGGLILIEGHEELLEEPLNLDDVMPDSFKGIMVLDRWSGISPSVEIIDDISDPDFGLPKFYECRDGQGNIVQTVHHSRMLRFVGRKLPFIEEQMETMWGASEVEHVYDELVKRDNTSWNIAALVFQANLLINKVDGMDQMLAMADEEAQRNYYNVKKAQNMMRSNSSMMIVGKEEEVTALNYTFSGLSDVYNDFMLDICGAAEMPMTKLFGRSPAGMNATGESDEQNYYDMIGKLQESQLKPALDKLLPIMFMSEFGAVPNDLGIKFNPTKTPSDTEQADLVDKKVNSINTVYNSGIIGKKIALKELHEISYTSNMFSNITDEDIEAAENEIVDVESLGASLGNLTQGIE